MTTTHAPISIITIHQPYASLIALGIKPDETRSWRAPRTLIGGLLAIHAGKNTTTLDKIRTSRAEIAHWSEHERGRFYRATPTGSFLRHIDESIADINALPLGAVVCIARVVACHNTETVARLRSEAALTFGDYKYGRYAWELEVVHVFATPVPAYGRQGIQQWTPPSSLDLEALR